MKHVTYADKSLLLDDLTADLLVDYAVAIGEAGVVDSVTARALDASGHQVEATFLLNASTEMMTETADSELDPVRNDEAIAYLREHLDRLRRPPFAAPEDLTGEADGDGTGPRHDRHGSSLYDF